MYLGLKRALPLFLLLFHTLFLLLLHLQSLILFLQPFDLPLQKLLFPLHFPCLAPKWRIRHWIQRNPLSNLKLPINRASPHHDLRLISNHYLPRWLLIRLKCTVHHYLTEVILPVVSSFLYGVLFEVLRDIVRWCGVVAGEFKLGFDSLDLAKELLFFGVVVGQGVIRTGLGVWTDYHYWMLCALKIIISVRWGWVSLRYLWTLVTVSVVTLLFRFDRLLKCHLFNRLILAFLPVLRCRKRDLRRFTFLVNVLRPKAILIVESFN